MIVHSIVDSLHDTLLHLSVGRTGQAGLAKPSHGPGKAAEPKVVVYHRDHGHTSHKCILAFEVDGPVGIGV